MQRFLPMADLQPFMKDFIFIKDARPSESPPERLLPDGNFMLVINLQNGYLVQNATRTFSAEKSVTGYLHGHSSSAFYLHKTAVYQGIALHFTPDGLYHLLRTSLHELPMDAIFTTEELFGKWGKELATHLWECSTPEAQIACLERLLQQKFRKVGYINQPIMPILNWIEQYKGNLSVEALATQFFISRKTLERRFLQRVGLPPKQYLRIIRFRHAYTQLCLGDYKEMLDLVAENGYFDQMHMIKEFKQFVGFTPTELLEKSDLAQQLYHNAYRTLEHQEEQVGLELAPKQRLLLTAL